MTNETFDALFDLTGGLVEVTLRGNKTRRVVIDVTEVTRCRDEIRFYGYRMDRKGMRTETLVAGNVYAGRYQSQIVTYARPRSAGTRYVVTAARVL